MTEEVVAEVELDVAGYADENPALRVEEDAFDEVNRDQQSGIKQNGLPGGAVLFEVVNGFADDARTLHGNRIGGNDREAAPHISPAVAAHVGEERAQIAKHISYCK